MARLLTNYDRLQSMPFGQYREMTSGAGARQVSSQRRALQSALRRGIRNARRGGDFATVAQGLRMGNIMGLQTTGIQSYDARKEADFASMMNMQRQAQANQALANRALAGTAGTDKPTPKPLPTQAERTAFEQAATSDTGVDYDDPFANQQPVFTGQVDPADIKDAGVAYDPKKKKKNWWDRSTSLYGSQQ